MANGIGACLTNEEQRAHLIDLRRDCRVKTEPAKRVSPITLQALIPTTRRLARLRLTQAYSKPRPQPTRAMSAAVGVLARQHAVKQQSDSSKLVGSSCKACRIARSLH